MSGDVISELANHIIQAKQNSFFSYSFQMILPANTHRVTPISSSPILSIACIIATMSSYSVKIVGALSKNVAEVIRRRCSEVYARRPPMAGFLGGQRMIHCRPAQSMNRIPQRF